MEESMKLFISAFTAVKTEMIPILIIAASIYAIVSYFRNMR